MSCHLENLCTFYHVGQDKDDNMTLGHGGILAWVIDDGGEERTGMGDVHIRPKTSKVRFFISYLV